METGRRLLRGGRPLAVISAVGCLIAVLFSMYLAVHYVAARDDSSSRAQAAFDRLRAILNGENLVFLITDEWYGELPPQLPSYRSTPREAAELRRMIIDQLPATPRRRDGDESWVFEDLPAASLVVRSTVGEARLRVFDMGTMAGLEPAELTACLPRSRIAVPGLIELIRQHSTPEGVTMTEESSILEQLPKDLHYLITPAMTYGRYRFDDDIFRFLDEATAEQMDELASVAERVLRQNDYPRVLAFLDEHPITDSEEAARLYSLFGVLEYADLQFDSVPEDAR
jgi:hypothetical protein